MTNLRLRANSPIIKYLEKEQKVLHRENLMILPAFLSLWPQEKEEIETKNISMFIPLISRDRLIAILVLGEKCPADIRWKILISSKTLRAVSP